MTDLRSPVPLEIPALKFFDFSMFDDGPSYPMSLEILALNFFDFSMFHDGPSISWTDGDSSTEIL
jgi:hypothetical protein